MNTTLCSAAIAGDQGGGPNAAPLVSAVLIERQADQRLDARQEDRAVLLAVLGVEREAVVDGHALLRDKLR
jgi:hypothetical protein